MDEANYFESFSSFQNLNTNLGYFTRISLEFCPQNSLFTTETQPHKRLERWNSMFESVLVRALLAEHNQSAEQSHGVKLYYCLNHSSESESLLDLFSSSFSEPPVNLQAKKFNYFFPLILIVCLSVCICCYNVGNYQD